MRPIASATIAAVITVLRGIPNRGDLTDGDRSVAVWSVLPVLPLDSTLLLKKKHGYHRQIKHYRIDYCRLGAFCHSETCLALTPNKDSRATASQSDFAMDKNTEPQRRAPRLPYFSGTLGEQADQVDEFQKSTTDTLYSSP